MPTPHTGDLYSFNVGDVLSLNASSASRSISLGELPEAEYLLVLTGQVVWNSSSDPSNPPRSLSYGVTFQLLNQADNLLLKEDVNFQEFYVGDVNYRRSFVQQAATSVNDDVTLRLEVTRGDSMTAPSDLDVADVFVSALVVERQN